MKYPDLKYGLLVTSIALTLCFGGCSEEEGLYTTPKTEEQITGTDNTKLILSLHTNSVTSRSMATEIEGKTEESSYKSLTLYITDTEDNIEKAILFDDIDNQKNLVIVMDEQGVNLDTPKHIYLVANPKETLAENIRTAIGRISNIDEVATDGSFLMFGQVESENGKEISFIKGDYILASVTLTRLVAKVLLTTEIKNGFVKNVEDGFIRQNNLRYVLQTTNSEFYYLPKDDNADPNYAMNELITKTGSSFSYVSGKENLFLNRDKWSVAESNGKAVTQYDAARIEENSKNPYTEGLYCLENTTSAIGSFQMNNAEKINVPKMVTTYLRIAAKVTPNKIDGTTYTVATSAESKLASNDGTFYTYLNANEEDKKMCYSSIAMAKSILSTKGYINLTNDNFKEYKGGWIYFDVYVNGKDFDANKSSLIRNNYYIANITNIVVPLVEQTIEISTTVRGWTDKGTTNVDIPVIGGTTANNN